MDGKQANPYAQPGFYLADCMDAMRRFPDGFFDLAIVDPPYGIGADEGTGGYGITDSRHYTAKWDNAIPPKEYFNELFRVSCNQIIWGAQYFTDYLTRGNKWIVWDKTGEGNYKNPYSKCELAWTSKKGIVDKFVSIQMGFIATAKENRIHPTQKPVRLYEWLLKNYANPGDKILDTHVGSASSLIACHRGGYDYWGFEIDETYYRMAKERLDREKAQVSIFNIEEFDDGR